MFFGGTRVQIAMISAVRVAHRDLTSLMRRIGRVRVPAASSPLYSTTRPPGLRLGGRFFYADFFVAQLSKNVGIYLRFLRCFLVLKQYIGVRRLIRFFGGFLGLLFGGLLLGLASLGLGLLELFAGLFQGLANPDAIPVQGDG